ncbi:hypothetical protein [Desulfonema magnum]|uniref:hypothetical protein n=1 Tax=Desulfonema magnum TaxID=45655 RepID=UPI001A9B6757|nr:hypothetical protein [Desulfonema magnum]
MQKAYHVLVMLISRWKIRQTLVPMLRVRMPFGRFASFAAGSFVTRSVCPAFPRKAWERDQGANSRLTFTEANMKGDGYEYGTSDFFREVLKCEFCYAI